MKRINQNYFSRIIGIATCTLMCVFASFSQEEEFTPAPVIVKDKALKSQISKHYVVCTDNIDRNFSGLEETHLRGKMLKRKESIYDLISEGKLIYTGELYEYVQGVANKVFAEDRKVYLIRSESPDAYNIGDDNLFVHIGLLERLSNEDELAYVLGHLIAHNELDHFEERMVGAMNLHEDAVMEELIEKIKMKEYCPVSDMSRLMVPWVLTRDLTSKKQETDADAFACLKMKDAGYDPSKVGGVFEILDHNESNITGTSFDINRILGLEQMRSNFSKELNFAAASASVVVKVGGSEIDKLRLHAFSVDRKKAFVKTFGENAENLADETYLTYQGFARKEVIVHAIKEGEIEVALFYLFQVHQQDSTDLFSRKLIPFCFAYLGLEKKRDQSEKPVGFESLESNENYNRTISFLESLEVEQCIEITEYWNTRVERDLEKYLKNANEAVLSLIKEDIQTFDLQLMRENDPRYSYLPEVLKKLAKNK
ncbi:MAG: Zn-dependent protease with chaperone function [Crocinitomicaceae bacterium]|jgi:Zn-dependent protease with chaperone function